MCKRAEQAASSCACAHTKTAHDNERTIKPAQARCLGLAAEQFWCCPLLPGPPPAHKLLVAGHKLLKSW